MREQNWRNKNTKKRTILRYADECPNFDSNSDKYKMLPVIPNASLCKNVKMGKITIIVTNTCGFDALCQIFSTGLLNNEPYNNALLCSSAKFILCAQILIKERLSAKFFKERAKILSNIKQLKANKIKSIIKVNATCNIANLTTWLLEDVPSFTEINTCDICNRAKIRRNFICNVNYNIIREKGVQCLIEAINEELDIYRTCCGKSIKSNIAYGPHLIIEIDCGEQRLIKLIDFPLELHITCNNKYILSGIIAYEGNDDVKSVGHYIAYIKTGKKWFYYDDATSKGRSGVVDEQTSINAHLCIYITSSNQC